MKQSPALVPRLLCAAALALCAVAAPATAADEPVSRLLVKFRDAGAKALLSPTQRTQRLAADAGVGVRYLRPMAVGAHVVALPGPLPAAEARAAAQALAAHPDVEYAEPDRLVHLQRAANDEFVGAQTYLDASAAGISAFTAWDVTTGSAGGVVAVIDSGYRPHVDLAGRILPGYDFISDPVIANDGDGRDADATDPGDWIDDADLAGAFKNMKCTKQNSDWHGTAVAGIIAANSNNSAWVAGIDWAARILPVRALGKCGGYMSDIVDGIAWAAGLDVPGVPANPTPAQVINLSVGDTGPCSAAEGSVISAALARGITRAILVAAGNDRADVANDTPANCPGAIAVASTNSRGGLASYSNSGAGITLSAPGGDYSPGFNPLDGIYALSNYGTTIPAADGVAIYNGTSFATPVVAGVVSLMLAVAPGLTAAQVRSALVGSAKPFPAGSTCSTANCGAGIVNADGAVRAALALTGGVAPSPVVEYYWASRDHYFITAAPAEIAALDASPPGGWVRTGYAFKGYLQVAPGTSPVCRFYLPPVNGDSHFYSASPAECAAVRTSFPTFVYEAPNVFYSALPDTTTGICPPAAIPVYRLWNNRVDGNHRYTTDPAVKAQMLSRGYVAEGYGPDAVIMCSPP